MIGYGFYRLLLLVFRRSGAKVQLRPALLYQIPLMFTAVMFGVIFSAYRTQEFGK